MTISVLMARRMEPVLPDPMVWMPLVVIVTPLPLGGVPAGIVGIPDIVQVVFLNRDKHMIAPLIRSVIVYLLR